MEFLDRVVFINLDHREDRLAQITEEMEKIGLGDKASRFPAIKHASPGLGCTLSHLEVMKQAAKDNVANILIFEDDFRFAISEAEFAERLSHLFELEKWGVAMFGYNNQKEKPLLLKDGCTQDACFGITNETQTASCYLINGPYLRYLIPCLEEGAQKLAETGMHWLYMNDQCWKVLQGDDMWLYSLKRGGFQRSSYSDLGGAYHEESYY